MPQPPQFSGSLAGFTQRAPQQRLAYPHAASQPAAPASPVPDSPLPASIAPLLLPLPLLEPPPPEPLPLEPPLPELPDPLLAELLLDPPLLLPEALLPLLDPPVDDAPPEPLALDPRPPEPPPLELPVVERSSGESTPAASVDASSPKLGTNDVPPQCQAAVTPRDASDNQAIRRMIHLRHMSLCVARRKSVKMMCAYRACRSGIRGLGLGWFGNRGRLAQGLLRGIVAGPAIFVQMWNLPLFGG
jgi:hypothetical protein